MKLGFTRRGQPLIVLILLLGGWVSARAMLFDPAELPEATPLALSAISATASTQNAARQPQPEADAPVQAGMSRPGDLSALPADADEPPAAAAVAFQPDSRSFAPAGPAPVPMMRLSPTPRELAPPPPPIVARVPPAIAAGHQLLWMAALSRIPMPPELLGMTAQTAAPLPFYPAGSPQDQGQNISRWSADGWLLWRRGSKLAPAGGLLTPSYGASQAGAVLRYRLAPDSPLRPAAYLRATAALNGSGEREAALGLSLRPISRLPLSVQGEARFTSTPGGKMVRPAGFVVTELPPFALPLGLRGEAYGQAGYVGGKFATGFADGQLRVDHRLLNIGKAEMRLGGGSWGGIQKGASRLDAGPSLTIGQPLGGPASLRLAADWRFRVAGKAAPGSGPAVTLSAGF